MPDAENDTQTPAPATGGEAHVRDSSGAAPQAAGAGGSPPPGRDTREAIAATWGQEVTGEGNRPGGEAGR